MTFENNTLEEILEKLLIIQSNLEKETKSLKDIINDVLCYIKL